ncbi:hypothetical protein C0580_04755 [Candidatus Parcubacteria bacterium]|nr:MAG: hypothetical protein C0580_04755 [Candidatus Parcubacteria bacterium]
MSEKDKEPGLLKVVYSQYRIFHIVVVIIAIVGSILFIREINTESLANGGQTLTLWRSVVVTICFSLMALVISGAIVVLAIVADVIERGGKPHSS